MADEKVLKTRIVNKHDTEAKWLKATTFVPKAGELIVYDPDTTYNYTRIKIGDGSTKVNALPFSFDKLTAGSNITISDNTISSPSISITNGTATTPTTDTVAVISGETASGHTITTTKVNVATKDYVDRKSVAAVQYLGTVSNTNELAALNPNSVGDFCRVAAAFSSYHAGDLLLCKTLKTSSAAATWDVIHGEIDKDTWTANSKNAAGYVAAGGTNANKVWKTDASGNPAWRDDANTNTAHAHTVGSGLSIEGSGDISGTTKYSLKVASSSEIGGVKPGTTSGKTYGVAVASDGAMTVSVPWTDTNTDTKVTQTVTTSNAAYPLLLAPFGQTATTTTTSYFDSGVTLNPSTNTIAANVTGNAGTATKLAAARTIALSGDVSGSTTFDGSGNVTITTAVADDSHNHIISNVDGLQTALDKKVPKRTSDGVSYTGLGTYYASGDTAKYVKISFPSVPTWTMATMELTIRESYTNKYSGKLIIYANQSSNQAWNISAIAYGTLTTAIKVYGSDKQHIYIGGIASWGGLSLDRMLIGDAAVSSDLTAMTITGVASLPTTYQTAAMYYGIHSGNIGSQSVHYATSAGSATKATQDASGNTITSTYATKTELTNGLAGKADSSHGTHVSYSTTAPLMDGTASAGSASTVARSDHKHPTDTSRAAASDLTSHTGNTTVHITSTERTNWNAAKTHADSAHAPSNAEKNQNAFSNITVGSTTIAADSTTDTLTLVGSNVTITPDATNDKVTIGITKENVTNALGYTPPTTNTTYVAATQSAAGLMSADDKKKLDSIASGATKVTIDSALSSTSTNPVQNKAINSALAGKSNVGHTHDYIPTSQKGTANGVASLDSNGRVPSSQLPSYVDDVLEYSAKSSFPSTGESGKIYVDTSTNLTYRWSGSAYVEISPSLALGETSSTAYRGDRGKIAYDHSQTAHAPSNAEKNQNAFSNVVVGSTTIAADSATDTLTLVAGTNVTLTPDATNDKVTITASDTKVTQTVTTSNAAYPLLLAPSGQTATATTTAYFDSGVTLNPSTNTIAANVSGNAGTTTKLATARTIGLGTGATGTATSFNGSANITIPVTSVKEAYLDWGGKNFYGSYGPIDAAMVPELGANRLAFIPASAIVLEYSRDSGSTWSAYSLSDESKINLFNGNGAGVYIGASSATGINKSSYMVRVTINTSAAQVYTVLNKFVIYCGTQGSTGCYCTIQGRLQSNYEAGTETWTTFADKVSISGWSGYNVINTSGITTYGNTKPYQYGQVRFTFGTTGHSDTNYPGLSIIKIFGFGGVGWVTPSTMAKTGHMYTYDYAQNVTFPAAVTAIGFVEGTTALSSKYAAKNHKHSVTAAGTNSSTSITPAGTVSQPTFTGTAASHNHTFTGTAAEHTHTFTGTQTTASVKYTPAGTVSSSFTGTAHNHTFSGTPATSGKPDTTNVTTIYSITGVGTLPSASLSSGTLPSCSYTAPSHSYTAPSLTGSVSNQCLTLTFNAGSHSFNAGSHSFSAGAFPTLTFSAGTLPTREAVSVPNTNHTHSVTATGTIGNATAGGTVSSTFAGTEATISHTFTPAGSISKTSITPAGTISSKELTPAGTVSKPTFTGTAASHTHTFTGSAVNSAAES